MADLNTLVNQFVAQLEILIEQRAAERVKQLAEELARGSGPRRGRPPKAGNGAAPKAGRAARVDVAEMAEKVFRFISDNRDQGVSRGQILSTFGITTSQYSYITDKLRSEKRIEPKGEKRAARWYPAGAAKPQTSLPIADTATTGKGKRGRKAAAKKAA